jgi:hypothetical protein
MRNPYRLLVLELERKRPCRRPRHQGENNTKMDLKEMGFEDVDWIELAQDRFH